MESSRENDNIIRSIILSVFDDEGPIPVYWPSDMAQLNESARLLIAMKTISLLMGDAVYQDGNDKEEVNYFGILPFPDLNLKGLTYFFLIFDEQARGQAKAATITVLIDDENKSFLYENMKYLRVIIDKTASNIQDSGDPGKYKEIMDSLKIELNEFCKEIKDPFSSKRTIKIIFAGLDKAGKTSFLHAVRKKYSEIIKTLPTKGVSRTEEKIFEEQNSQISLWDLGGQKKYLEKYLEESKFYLYNVDLLFYMIDVQDIDRTYNSIELLKNIIDSLIDMDEYPPIVICLNKYDPDLRKSKEINKNIKFIIKHIEKNSDKFFIKIFRTSIFDYWSVISSYSYGLSQLSPNREFFKKLLENFADNTNAEAVLLLNENGIILSNYSNNRYNSKVFAISAPHFQTLYKTFKEFKLLKKDFLISSGIIADKDIIFKKIKVEKYDLYLLLLLQEYLSIEKIEIFLPDLSKNLIELMNTYL